jgi:hypothetical protein
MHAIIFSKNSPKSLGFFLNSIKENNINFSELSVIYSSEDNNVLNYLNLLTDNNIFSHIHSNKSSFKEDLELIISESKSAFITFFKETNYLFDSFNENDIKITMDDEDIFCFSLNLGRNVTQDFYSDCYNILLNEVKVSDNIIKFNWNKHHLSFGRCLELSGGYIYRKKDILKIFKRWKYDSIEKLEESFELLEYFPREEMACFEKNVCVDISNIEIDKEKLSIFDWNNIDRQVIMI